MASNPLIGAAWGGQGQNPLQNANPIQLPGMPGVSTPGGTPSGDNQPFNSPSAAGGPWGNPGGYHNPTGAGAVNRNQAINNIIAGQMKNQLAPQFAQLMSQYGGQAGNLFSQLANLGSPYYQQKQSEAFGQGVRQNENAQGLAREQLRAQGYGSTPSGATAAMIGGMNQAGAQSLSEQYLQNLFQNEAMQLQGGQGLASLAGMFNPTQMLGGIPVGNVQQDPTFGQTFGQIMGGIGDVLSGGGNMAKGAGG
jgi:hypothetical protein